MNNKFSHFLKYLAVFATFSITLPIIMLFQIIVANSSDNTSIIAINYLVVSLVGFIGYCVEGVIHLLRNKTSAIVLNVTKLIVAALICSITLIVYLQFHWVTAITQTIICGIVFFVGTHHYFTDYTSIVLEKHISASIVVNVIAIFFMWLLSFSFGARYDLFILMPTFLFLVGTFLFISNQANIDNLMQRRKHSFSNLPVKIRYYNVLLTGVILVVILCGFIFRTFIVSIIGKLWLLIKAGIGIIFKILELIGSIFSVGGGDIVMEEGRPLENGAMIGEETKTILPFLLTILFIAVILKLIHFYRHEILQAIANLWRLISNLISSILMKFTFIRNMQEVSEDYSDTVEELAPISRDIIKEKPNNTSRHDWRKKYKKYQQMDDSLTKFNYGYRLIIDGLILNGIEIPPSDTTLEILLKSVTKLTTSAYPKATDIYNEVNYSEVILNLNDITYVTQALAALREVKMQ